MSQSLQKSKKNCKEFVVADVAQLNKGNVVLCIENASVDTTHTATTNNTVICFLQSSFEIYMPK